MSDYARNLDTYNDGYGDPSEQDDFEMPEPTTLDQMLGEGGEPCPDCGEPRDVWADGLVEMCGSCGDPAYELEDDDERTASREDL